MKNRYFLALPLAAALMTPAFAQQATTPQDQNTQTTQQQQTTATSTESTRQPLVYERHEGFWGKLNPFARKKYVQRQLDPVRNRVNELDELTKQNSQMIRDVDTRAQEGIRVATNRANEADQHAMQAGQTAQQALQTGQQATTRLTTVEQVVTNIDQYQPATETEIRFRNGAVLSKKAKTALDEMVQPLGNQRGYIIQVEGYGASPESARRMSDAVTRYLVIEHNMPHYRIHNMGLKAGKRADGTRVRSNTVLVRVMKNNVEQLASAGTTNTNYGQPQNQQPPQQQ